MTYYSTKKVLIVDDDPSVREMLSYFLLSKGFDVGSAEDGYAALDILDHSSFDFLIVDVNMPRMNGIDLLKCLKERNINTPSIIITGIMSKKVQKEAVALKVSNVIDKPFSLHEILQSIQEGLDKAETLNQS